MSRTIVAVLMTLSLGSIVAMASSGADAVGDWNRDDGLGGVRIASCGQALCGRVFWLRDKTGPAYVGQQVLYDMHRSGPTSWSGSAVNPADGRTYAGTLLLDGRHMTTRGCAFGGMICQSVALTRAN